MDIYDPGYDPTYRGPINPLITGRGPPCTSTGGLFKLFTERSKKKDHVATCCANDFACPFKSQTRM